MNAETLKAIPPAGWALLFLLAGMAGAALFGLCRILLKRDVRLKHLEVSSRKELAAEKRITSQYDIVALLTSQLANSVNLLQKIRIDLFEAGKKCLRLEMRGEFYILEDIAKLIECRIEREVFLDLVRNHFGNKSKEELIRYADAKAEGYWRRVKTELYKYSAQLPNVSLASIMEHIPIDSYRELFEEVYSAASRIAGEHIKNSKEET